MPSRHHEHATEPLLLSDDEAAIVEYFRALKIDRTEALRRLGTPLANPILPGGPELQANMPIAAEILVVSESQTAMAEEIRK